MSDPVLVGVDVGTTKVCIVAGALNERGGLDIVGVGTAPSRGIRRGVVVSLEQAVESIRAAVQEAELTSGIRVDRAVVGVPGAHVRCFNSRGVVATSRRGRGIAREDLRRVIEAARAISIPQDREFLHVLPQEYSVDDQDGIGDPLGMTGTRLEAQVHLVTAATTPVQNLVTCLHRAGIQVTGLVLEALAVAETVLTHDDKELGVGLVDIGGGTTDLALFERGAAWHSAFLPMGGDHFTNDIAVGLRTPVPEAERIKKRFGCTLPSLLEEDAPIEVPSVGNRKPRILSRRLLCEILNPRAEELFQLLEEEVARLGFEKRLNAGLVMTGGGSELDGLPEVAESVFNLPARRGVPVGVGGLTDVVASPQCTTAVGLVLHGLRVRQRDPALSGSWKWTGMGGRLRSWFAELF